MSITLFVPTADGFFLLMLTPDGPAISMMLLHAASLLSASLNIAVVLSTIPAAVD